MNWVPFLGVGAGGIHVDAAFEKYVEKQLAVLSDRRAIEEAVSEAVDDFESQAKRTFGSPSDVCRVRVGPRNWSVEGTGISRGILIING